MEIYRNRRVAQTSRSSRPLATLTAAELGVMHYKT